MVMKIVTKKLRPENILEKKKGVEKVRKSPGVMQSKSRVDWRSKSLVKGLTKENVGRGNELPTER